MVYERIQPGVFLSRTNRFLAEVDLGGRVERCHVKNTGHCKELLRRGAPVYVQTAENPDRKTKYDLISVRKREQVVNIDSQAPNRLFAEWVQNGNLFHTVTKLRPECKYGSSRFDFYLEADGRNIFAEVKGVTLEKRGTALFPDAPTERGVRHLRELCDCVQDGFDAYVVFVIQMQGVRLFRPNYATHPQFGAALAKAAAAGVHIFALDCTVTPDSIAIRHEIPIDLFPPLVKRKD